MGTKRRVRKLEQLKTVTIKGVNIDLYRRAKAEAIKAGKKLGDWINEAMALKLRGRD